MARRTPLLKLHLKQERRAVAQDKTKTEDKAQDKIKRVFVITPIGADGSPERLHADWVLNAAIKPVFEPRGYEVFRSDSIADPAMINDAIFQHVIEDEVCVADLSFLNPNVFYELGVRHALEKPVIHIAHDAIRLPFDTAQHRVAFFNLAAWQSVEALKAQIAGQLDTIEADGFKVSNPLTHARGRQKLAESADSKDRLIAELLGRVERLETSAQRRQRYSGVTHQGMRIALSLPPHELETLATELTHFLRSKGDDDGSLRQFTGQFGAILMRLTKSDRVYLDGILERIALDSEFTSLIEMMGYVTDI